MMPTQYLFPKNLFSLNALLAGLPYLLSLMLVVWIITFLSLPIIEYFYGEAALSWGIIAGVMVQTAVVSIALYQAWGTRRTIWTVTVVLVMAWTIEFAGSSTGIPFGDYDYTDSLQPQVAGVPLFIPLAWLMMLPPAWAVAQRLVGNRHNPVFVAVSALAFTAWDLFLDPQMVAWGVWVWAPTRGYFGIPWLNYAGWLLASAFITALVRPSKLPIKPLLLIYTITWVLETAGLILFWHLPGPALVGGLGMGSLAWLAWSSRQEERS
jgi:putative membrane protein